MCVLAKEITKQIDIRVIKETEENWGEGRYKEH